MTFAFCITWKTFIGKSSINAGSSNKDPTKMFKLVQFVPYQVFNKQCLYSEISFCGSMREMMQWMQLQTLKYAKQFRT